MNAMDVIDVDSEFLSQSILPKMWSAQSQDVAELQYVWGHAFVLHLLWNIVCYLPEARLLALWACV